MRRVWSWIRDRWHWLLLALALAGVFVGARRILRTLRDEAALRRAEKRVEELRADRAELERDATRNAASLEKLDEQILAERIDAVRAYEEGQGLRGRKLERALEELGF